MCVEATTTTTTTATAVITPQNVNNIHLDDGTKQQARYKKNAAGEVY